MELSLDGTWKLFYFEPGKGLQQRAHTADFDEREAIPVQVPGDVHTALIRAGVLPDPYYDENPEACGWVEDYEWWYRTTFTVPADLRGERFELVFEGLDTLADVYLNGEKVGSAQNMFTPYRFDVTSHLRLDGQNLLAICFHPVVLEAEKKDVSRYWAAFYKPRVWLRKAQMNWGWDWAPRFVTVGVWRPVRLEAYSVARIAHLFAYTERLDRKRGAGAPERGDRTRRREQSPAGGELFRARPRAGLAGGRSRRRWQGGDDPVDGVAAAVVDTRPGNSAPLHCRGGAARWLECAPQ
jgi:beta-mannosidase